MEQVPLGPALGLLAALRQASDEEGAPRTKGAAHGVAKSGRMNLVAVDPPATSLTFCGFSGKPLDFPKS